jgi:hypothetical protein
MTRAPSLKQLSCNLSLLTLDLWLRGCVAVWLYAAFAKRSRTPENQLSRARLKTLAFGSCQQTHLASGPGNVPVLVPVPQSRYQRQILAVLFPQPSNKRGTASASCC